MTLRFTTLDGETVDLENEWPWPYRPMDALYRHPYEEQSHPWWLTENLSNGSTTFNGLATTGGSGTLDFSTNGTAAGDYCVVETPAIVWDDRDEIWFAAMNIQGSQLVGDASDDHYVVSMGDAVNPANMSNGFYIQTNTSNSSVTWEVLNGGTSQVLFEMGNKTSRMFGFRIFRNPDNAQTNGHTIVWYRNWQPMAQYSEDLGFPPTTGEYPLRTGIVDGNGDGASGTLDTVVMGL